MRRGLGLFGLLVTIVIVAIVGVIAYQAGWSDGFAQHAPAVGSTAGPGYYPYYYGPHFFGFGWIFGLLFFLFFLWVIFRVIGFAFWGMRGMGGYRGGWHQFRDERMREWHDRAHSGQAGGEQGSQSPPPPPTTA